MGLLDTVRRDRRAIISLDARQSARLAEEQERVRLAEKRRDYYRGSQYDTHNAQTLASIEGMQQGDRLPEHRRLHAYSTQVAECIDFLADRLGEGFTVKAANATVQKVIDDVVSSTPTIAAETEEGDIEIVTDDLLRDAFQTGDVPVYVGWDPIEGRPYWEFWESEDVEFVEGDRAGLIEKVVRRVIVWRELPGPGGVLEEREVEERTEFSMQINEAGFMECRRDLYWDQDEAPRETEWLGIGRLPWTLLRADGRRLREFRGEALITKQSMETADRYNAVEQIAFLIARYNSHGNVAVIGDGASLKVEQDGRMNKDVADVLTFPGGTSLQVITLPTDPQMIEHQKGVLADAMYSVFGLTRVDNDTIGGLGGISGYALEILNQKSEATFKRIRRRWRKDFTALLGLTLDMTAWKQNAPVGVLDAASREFIEWDGDVMDMDVLEGEVPVQAWWTIDPAVVFPERKVEIRMGSGYIVDEVMIRDDFTAKLISQKEALRKRGYGDEDIKKIMDEQAEEAPPVPEGGAFGAPAPAVRPGLGSASKTKAGSTVASSTERK